MKKQFLIFTAVIFVLINSSCFFSNPQTSEQIIEIDFSLPEPNGKFAVGRQLIYLSDETRQREIAAWIYYPAETAENSSNEPVLPAKWADAYRDLLEKRLGKSAANALLKAGTNAETDAEILSSKENFPVLIFAPGANWLPTDYSALIEDAASGGYIVIAFAAPPLSPVIQLSDGKFFESPRVDETAYETISRDFRFIAERLEQLNQNSSLKIKSRIDLNKVGAFGHSIGGAAAVLAAANDPKISAAANLDGDFAGEAENAAPSQAIFYMTTEPPNLGGAPVENWDEDRSETRRKNVWQNVSANSQTAFRVRAAGMFHSNFQDAALLPPDSMPEKFRRDRFGKIEGRRGVRLTAELVRAFFDSQLKSAPVDDFLNIGKQYSEIKIEQKLN